MKTKNVLRECLKGDKPTIGTMSFVMWPGMVEVIGHSGSFDYIEFSGQYAPYNLHTLEDFARTVDTFDHMTSMIKIDQEPRAYLASRSVISGIQNVLFSDIRNVEDATDAVMSMSPATPDFEGRVGIGGGRDVGYVPQGLGGIYSETSYHIKNTVDGVVVLMIEKKEAVDNLEKILSVQGVDMVQFGSSDYSITIGKSGQNSDPEVVEAEDYMIETALRLGVAPRAVIKDWREADRYMRLGVKHFCIGFDISTIYNFCNEKGGSFAKKIGR